LRSGDARRSNDAHVCQWYRRRRNALQTIDLVATEKPFGLRACVDRYRSLVGPRLA